MSRIRSVQCLCGRKFECLRHLVEHKELLRPPRVMGLSRLLPWLTREKVDQARAEYSAWDKAHGIGSFE